MKAEERLSKGVRWSRTKRSDLIVLGVYGGTKAKRFDGGD